MPDLSLPQSRKLRPVGNITVNEVRDRRAWEHLKQVWNPLLAESASGTTFLTWEWLTAWWSAYGNADDLRILTASDESGTIRGLAPLRRVAIRRYGQGFHTLAFVGDGSHDSDYLDFIVARGFEERVVETWANYLREELSAGLILRLNEIPAESPNLRALKHALPRHLWVEQAVPCGTVDLPRDWNEYLGTLRPRFRTKVRSVLRHLEGQPDVRFGFCESESELERLLPALFELHTRRWNQDGHRGVFGWDKKRQFYGALSPTLLQRGSLRFSWLEWNGRVLACQYGFVYGDSYLHLQEGYEPATEHWNVGVGLRAWSIREMLRTGVRRYDFLAGMGRHKADWGAQVKENARLSVAAPSYRNLLFCRGPQWQQLAKEAAKSVLPASLLVARRAHLREKVARQTSSSAPDQRIRRAAAKCYFHLGGPAATRVVRQRYQASVSPDGRLVRGSWTKRRQPAGRILYYHRVNDENDPFFPSLPLDVFDRQMRHIAGHYRVVTLRGLLDHLSSDSSDNVVAITFDDGYRDNYANAFPILERYGLPATIFLTTGSLDSGEPLWFEVLAGALKITSKESLDLELDLPRRFWLRNSDERLRANGELFALLRRMPDDERKRQLSLILRELAAPDAAKRTNTMLSWDQVRAMKPRGIDFGGHTVTHPYLSRLTGEQVIWEISECKRRIESELQTPVSHFAYPNGREEDFTPWNKDLLRNVGYQAAVTTLWGLNFPTTDPLELRRGGAWERDEAMFAYKMDWYQLVNG